ncbi:MULTISPECIES: Gfo/Idh/MocA family protein [unclassified Exiguobacterium]|uniref:Gfo/Idh/MocA family protein n=1 Tax=unclassified Exiguobacterium TaxID=2644629 RepID=UPI00103EF634|nr:MULTISPECIES: Gfo/Idh/MocA family oxidoreductase [unclassified Exiguobacterium]TCI48550.1 Gfo/Idh/MocA family oxidoreductase [Exiguobacterium sp. SH5S32]TCI55436.1 Gfo/Idh/MocA family oxidoreductase [Exiguobacterium sp. SH1S4]TCI75231.1 Gfo/Idh/MocA family oxidoreductase [Exiguobacterium sp. SH1S1]TCI76132.1 Gfo/Idh/MocA family oxidoreductase [Exiguobacterium sp. SH0S1]
MRKPKIGVVGLGGIAQKAYLPILTNSTSFELVGAYSPTQAKRDEICRAYRMESFTGLDSLASSVDAAFVHSSTETHYEVVSYLLAQGVDVYVDKPLAATVEQAERLVETAERTNRKLMVGFNRRFAPMYNQVKAAAPFHSLDFVKHRGDGLRGHDYRFTLLDDYLHVVDTLRYFAGSDLRLVTGQIETTASNGLHFARHVWQDENGLHTTSMHRKAGVNHEGLVAIKDGLRLTVDEMVTLHRFEHGSHSTETFGSWDTLLTQRGFQGAIDHFITALTDDTPILTDGREALLTQQLVTDLFSRR